MTARTIASILLLASLGIAAAVFADDILVNAHIARQHMQQLRSGLGLYYETHVGQPPAEPADLFPDYVPDPLAFYHPGDSDPPPETIDNSTPNAPNSARISFEWNLADYWPADRILLRDNTPQNNGGAFINMLTADGVIETDPPLATPTPTALELAHDHLRRIGWSLSAYANDSKGYLPDDLIYLWNEGRLETPRSFWNPGDDDPMPTDITNSKLDAPNSTQVSFEYLVAGWHYDAVTPETVVLRDISASNNNGLGTYVLKGLDTVELILTDACVVDLDDNGAANAYDLAILLASWGADPPGAADITGDGLVSTADLEVLLTHWGPCE